MEPTPDNQEKEYEREKFGGPPVRLSGYRLAEPLCRRRCLNRKQMQQEIAERRDPANVTAFFDNRRSAIPNPLAQIPECARVCERLHRAVENCERILLYGDYDCDGVTSITLMFDALKALGAQPSLIKPIVGDRLRDGYGLKWSRLHAHFKHYEEEGTPDLLIALDCGSNNPEEVRRLLECDIDVIVIDHHQLGSKDPLPGDGRVFHLNPWLWWKEKHARYCAAGMTYFVADALHAGGYTPWNRERGILLAGLATCADVVPLVGLNRKLLKHSLSLARDPEKLALVPGLKALNDRITLRWKFNEEVYSFYWGPCLNAPGRMGSADDAVGLLMATESHEAARFARRCLEANGWRKATERAILNSATSQAEAQMKDNRKRRVLFLCHPEWHPGVVGIVAAKVRDRFDRVTFVSSGYQNGVWKGSVRSIDGCDVGAMLQRAKVAGVLSEGGGHEMAGGITFLEEKRHELQDWLENNTGLSKDALVPLVETAAPVKTLVPVEWASALQELSPFGKDNRCPAFFVEAAELEGVRPRWTLYPSTRRAFLIGYEGLFRDVSTGGTFFALWRDWELADVVWEVHRFLDGPDPDPYYPVRLNCHFKLELELLGFIPLGDRANARRRMDQHYNFVVRQCERSQPPSTPFDG